MPATSDSEPFTTVVGDKHSEVPLTLNPQLPPGGLTRVTAQLRQLVRLARLLEDARVVEREDDSAKAGEGGPGQTHTPLCQPLAPIVHERFEIGVKSAFCSLTSLSRLVVRKVATSEVFERDFRACKMTREAC